MVDQSNREAPENVPEYEGQIIFKGDFSEPDSDSGGILVWIRDRF